jgi:hypothetical protein
MKTMKATGYQALISRFSLQAVPPYRSSWIHARSGRLCRQADGLAEEYYPPRYDPGNGWQAELDFALRHEGVELGILAALFGVLDVTELTDWIRASPTGKYARVAWFLYEWLTGRQLPLPDLTQGNYVPVLNPADYYCLPGTRVRRHRVVNNIPGNPAWCPAVRRSPALAAYEARGLAGLAATRLKDYPEELLARASTYLYTKETKTSFALEHLEPDARRAATFVAALRQAGKRSYLSREALVTLQNTIVDPRYADSGWRPDQNYIGQSLGPSREQVHYVPPRPQELPALAEGWIAACSRVVESDIDPVVAAAVEGFGFVFLHPFGDGNGRIHRFLIHHVLARRGFTPPGLIFPVSAAMLRQRQRYDECLEAYSQRLMEHIDWVLDNRGTMTVRNDTGVLYRYPDLTAQAEALYAFVEETINHELVAELDFLAAYDAARLRMVAVVDMPERRADLFVRLCLQGKGQLSKSKRPLFAELTDDEIQKLELTVREEILTEAGNNRES